MGKTKPPLSKSEILRKKNAAYRAGSRAVEKSKLFDNSEIQASYREIKGRKQRVDRGKVEALTLEAINRGFGFWSSSEKHWKTAAKEKYERALRKITDDEPKLLTSVQKGRGIAIEHNALPTAPKKGRTRS
jgi:hypothetical protein